MLFAKRTIVSLLAVSLIVMFVYGDSLAAKSKVFKPIGGEVGLNIGTFFHRFFISGMIGAGLLIFNVLEVEASLSIVPEEGAPDIIESGNLSLNLPVLKRVIPFATIGTGQCMHGVPISNYGAGIKIDTDKYFLEELGGIRIRMEYRYWTGWVRSGAASIGISFFF